MTNTNTLPGAGQTVTLQWPASEDYQFKFDLIYDEDGNLQAVQCEPLSRKTDFTGPYTLPMSVAIADVHIDMRRVAGHAPYDTGVWCKINVPGFIFEGLAFQFSNRLRELAPETAW